MARFVDNCGTCGAPDVVGHECQTARCMAEVIVHGECRRCHNKARGPSRDFCGLHAKRIERKKYVHIPR